MFKYVKAGAKSLISVAGEFVDLAFIGFAVGFGGALGVGVFVGYFVF